MFASQILNLQSPIWLATTGWGMGKQPFGYDEYNSNPSLIFILHGIVLCIYCDAQRSQKEKLSFAFSLKKL